MKGVFQDNVVIDDHFHNREYCFGVAAIPTTTHFADQDSLTPFVLTSGLGVFGTEVPIFGSSDMPVRPGSMLYDARVLSIVAADNPGPWIIRYVWETTPGQGAAAAEAAGQYSEIYPVLGVIVFDFKHDRIVPGCMLWAKALNSIVSTISILIAEHEYPSLSP